jgi:hypothetical protein
VPRGSRLVQGRALVTGPHASGSAVRRDAIGLGLSLILGGDTIDGGQRVIGGEGWNIALSSVRSICAFASTPPRTSPRAGRTRRLALPVNA